MAVIWLSCACKRTDRGFIRCQNRYKTYSSCSIVILKHRLTPAADTTSVKQTGGDMFHPGCLRPERLTLWTGGAHQEEELWSIKTMWACKNVRKVTRVITWQDEEEEERFNKTRPSQSASSLILEFLLWTLTLVFMLFRETFDFWLEDDQLGLHGYH